MMIKGKNAEEILIKKISTKLKENLSDENQIKFYKEKIAILQSEITSLKEKIMDWKMAEADRIRDNNSVIKALQATSNEN